MKISAIVTNGNQQRWVVSYLDDLERRKRKYFKTQNEAEDFAGRVPVSGDMDKWWMQLSFKAQTDIASAYSEAAKHGFSLVKAVHSYSEHADWSSSSGNPIKVSDSIQRFLSAKKEKGLRRRSILSLESVLGMFSLEYGHQSLRKVSPKLIHSFLKGNDWAAGTRRRYISDLTNFFNWCIRNEFLTKNPCSAVEKPVMIDSPPEIFSVEDVRQLLKTAITVDAELVPYFSVGMFAGLRPNSELEHLKPDDVKNVVIEVNSFKSKSARRRFVSIQPNLNKWLKKYPVGMPPRNLRRRKEAVIDISKVKWIPDGMRHSFGSYHLAHFQDSGKTSLEMGHSKPETLFNHYRERVGEKESKAFWSICPSDSCFSNS